MRVAIIGFGVEGQAAYDYWHQLGADITVCDQKTDLVLPANVTSQLGEDYLKNLGSFDVIVRSPFVRADAITAANSADIEPKITSSTNEFLRVCPTKNIIGITGTKGKGTTSTLVARILETADKRVHLGGNIGVAALELLKNNIQPDDWVVLEMSSFQLSDLKQSPHIAACLMIAPEHLDWHIDATEYFTAKQQLFRWQSPDDVAVFYSANEYSTLIAKAGNGQKIPYLAEPGAVVIDDVITIAHQPICNVADLRLLGKHNIQNACAAVTIVWQATNSTAGMQQVLTTFTGLEHRLELVREFNGVSYYDDSFGTTPETAEVAVQAFDQPKVLILGGSDKGADYTQLVQVIATNSMRRVLLIGEQAARLQAALDTAGFTNYQSGGSTMAEIIATAQATAQPGDVVLLSTGCASFDMFANYKDRGNQFKQAVRALA